jgi:ABC-type molybdate transport system substrate-binding protein
MIVGNGPLRKPLAATATLMTLLIGILVLGPSPSPAAREFLIFLGSPAAQQILDETGHAVLPLGPATPGRP